MYKKSLNIILISYVSCEFYRNGRTMPIFNDYNIRLTFVTYLKTLTQCDWKVSSNCRVPPARWSRMLPLT